jgi:entericidin B
VDKAGADDKIIASPTHTENTMLKKIMVIAAMFGMFGAISACNTVAGMGKDVQTGGEKVQDAAQDVQKKM